MRVKSNMSPESFACCGNKKCFCCLPETFACLSLQILSHATNFRRHVTRHNFVRDMSPSSAKPGGVAMWLVRLAIRNFWIWISLGSFSTSLQSFSLPSSVNDYPGCHSRLSVWGRIRLQVRINCINARTLEVRNKWKLFAYLLKQSCSSFVSKLSIGKGVLCLEMLYCL